MACIEVLQCILCCEEESPDDYYEPRGFRSYGTFFSRVSNRISSCRWRPFPSSSETASVDRPEEIPRVPSDFQSTRTIIGKETKRSRRSSSETRTDPPEIPISYQFHHEILCFRTDPREIPVAPSDRHRRVSSSETRADPPRRTPVGVYSEISVDPRQIPAVSSDSD